MGAALPPHSTSADSNRHRLRRLGVGSGALLAGRVVVALCGLVQVPIALAHLGAAAFGLWIALTGLVWSLSILDCGLGFALQNRFAALLAHGREADAAALARWARRTLLLGTTVVLAVALPLARWGNWPAWFGVSDPALHGQLRLSVAIALGAAALNLPLSLAARLAAATQQMWLTGVWTAIASGLGLAAIAAAAWLKLPLAGFTLAGCVLPLAPAIGTWWSLRRRHAWLRAPADATHRESGLWRDAALFFMPQLGAAFAGAFVPTLVVLFAGPVAAGTFGVLQRLFGFALQLQSLALMPTWPAYTDAAARGDAEFARRTFRTTLGLTAAGFILPMLALTPFAPAAIRLWLGANAPEIAPPLLWAMAGWHVLQFCGQPIAMVLNGVGRMEGLAVLVWIGLLSSLGLCAWLGPQLGGTGVLAALAAPYALLNLPITAWQARRALAAIEKRAPAPAPVLP